MSKILFKIKITVPFYKQEFEFLQLGSDSFLIEKNIKSFFEEFFEKLDENMVEYYIHIEKVLN